MHQELSDLWLKFADYSLGDYAPIYDRITRSVAHDQELLSLVLEAPAQSRLPNNLQAAVHFLVLGMPDHPLAEMYRGGAVDDLEREFRTFVLEHRAEVAHLMATRTVQTNETRRASALAPALAHVGELFGQPLALIDAGTSAGLNLMVDKHRVDYGAATRGPDDAALTVTADLLGATPPLTPLDIGWRRGFDRSPIDVGDPDEARWLRSLIWPDHPERGERMKTAIEVLQAHPAEIVQAEALEGLSAALRDAPNDMVPVVVTSWVVFYFPKTLRAEFDAAIVGADRPVAWVSMEAEGIVANLDAANPPPGESEPSLIGLVIGGPDNSASGLPAPGRTTLGWTHGHGNWLDWRAG